MSTDWSNLFAVKDKVALVTGGSRGIGKMIATGLVAHGARVYIASRNKAACDETASELNQLVKGSGSGGSCIAIPTDLTKMAELDHLVKEIKQRETKLHILVNNAGSNWAAPLAEFPVEAFAKVMQLNLHSIFTLTQRLFPLLEAAVVRAAGSETAYDDPARVINIGSIDGLRVPPQETYAYSASKAGLHHMTRHMAGHHGSKGITFNSISPGPFPSRMMKATLEQFMDRVVAQVPLGRIGQPADVAGLCIFLSSKAGAYVNGATIALDGGMVCKTSRL